VFDLIVVGNGALGTMCAIQAKRDHPEAAVCLVGPRNRTNAASTAAGAMANVLAEIEVGYGENDVTERFVEIGLEGRRLWLEFLEDVDAMHVVTAENTVVYLKYEASAFERENFAAMESYAIGNNFGQILSSDQVGQISKVTAEITERAVELRGEFAFDSRQLFEVLDLHAEELGIHFVDGYAFQVDAARSRLVLETGNEVVFDRCIMTAGSQTSNLLPKGLMLPMLQGVGSAFLVDPEVCLESLRAAVLRTVNRGGAQCGIHTVPRADGGLYIGAGNYITQPGVANHRLETFRYLFSTFESEYVGKTGAYPLTGQPLKGYRPRSIDGLPLIGPLKVHPNVAIVTAMNRVGLTWAPRIALAASSWFGGNGDQPFADFRDWYPDREPIPFGSVENSLNYFVQSRLGAAMEHRLIPDEASSVSAREEEIRRFGSALQEMADRQVGMAAGLSINPDNWNALVGRTQTSCDR
jgi:glycine oxidase